MSLLIRHESGPKLFSRDFQFSIPRGQCCVRHPCQSRKLGEYAKQHPFGKSCLISIRGRQHQLRPVLMQSRLSVDNRELLIGDCILLVAFCLYKQITSIILSPSFPGWLAPLHFNPSRFGELASFATTLAVSWVLSSLLVGGYRIRATSDLRTALAQVSKIWLISMPVAACQLVLLTAAEDKVLIGSDLFASALPLAASGPGEPIATAAGVLGIMAFWRCFYTAFLDFYNFRQWGDLGTRKIDRVQVMCLTITRTPLMTITRGNFTSTEDASIMQEIEVSPFLQDMMLFKETLKTVFILCIGGIIVMQYLSNVIGEDSLESFAASMHLLRETF